MLSNGLASNDGDDITYSSLTMRALQWIPYNLISGTLLFKAIVPVFQNTLTTNIRKWHI